MVGSSARRGAQGTAGSHDHGWSLIELLTVIAILGVIATIAVPTFLGQQRRAFSAAVQSDLVNAQTALETASADHGGDYVSTGLPTNVVLTGNEEVATQGAASLGSFPSGGGGRIGAAAPAASSANDRRLGFESSPRVSVWIETLTSTSYCLNGTHQGLDFLWHLSSGESGVARGGCSAESAVPTGDPDDESLTDIGCGTDGCGGGGSATTEQCEDGDRECADAALDLAADLQTAIANCGPDDDACLDAAKNDTLNAATEDCSLSAAACRAASREAIALVEQATRLGCDVTDAACLARTPAPRD